MTTKPFVILVGGRYGAGKGTMIANFVANSGYDVLVVETGGLIRTLLTKPEPTERDRELIELIKATPAGKLVADAIVFELVTMRLHEQDISRYNVIIFDGFPRNTPQTNWLTRQLQKLGLVINLVIEITLGSNISQARKVATARIKLRAKEAGERARKDDLNEGVIKTRQDDYDREVGDTFKRFTGTNLISIDGLQPKEYVISMFDAIVTANMYNRDLAD